MGRKNKKWILSISIIIILLVIGIGGKMYMNKHKIEKEYQQGIELVQDYVSDYLVKNYEGIEKIEWQGVGVEYRNSPILGPSLLGNYVDTDVKIYVSENTYFTMTFRLNDETDYSDELSKYVLDSSMNPQNIDIVIQSELENAIHGFKEGTKELTEEEKQVFKKFKYSSLGSPNNKITYSLKIHELRY